MKALILNSGLGSRMGELTKTQPKCMTNISSRETIISRQLQQLVDAGIKDVVITTGAFAAELVKYVQGLSLPLNISFVYNKDYMNTNYIYSLYQAREYVKDTDVVLMHGDMVFENTVFDQLISSENSAVIVSTTSLLPQKDFKAVVREGKVEKIGIDFFEHAVAAQPLYKLKAKDWQLWLDEISSFCTNGQVKCYAEDAFNHVGYKLDIKPLDVKDMLCSEIDNPADLTTVVNKLEEIDKRTVLMSFSTDIIHSAHIALIKKAARLGKLIVGLLTDEAIASYKRYPLVPFAERKALIENISGVRCVVKQHELSYKKIIAEFHPTYVVHGDDWREGFQKPVRDEVVACLAEYGGQLVEYPYSENPNLRQLEARTRMEMSLPDIRRSRLKKAIEMKKTITAIATHSGLTGLLAENVAVYDNGQAHQFDAMWISSLCDSTNKGKPDIELVDMTSRFRTIDEIMEVTTKPIIFDADTGGLKQHFIYTVRTLERMGVSMIIVEDKTGLKKNSLFGTEVKQTQDSIENFSEKIAAGKAAQKTSDFMICARIESLILERGMEDALLRARSFVKAGADAIMIHSRKKSPEEIFEFVDKFRSDDKKTILVVVPTTFNSVTEEEFKAHGVNIVIYANQLMRAGFPAMKKAAECILKNHRAQECDEMCMSFKEIIKLIPADY